MALLRDYLFGNDADRLDSYHRLEREAERAARKATRAAQRAQAAERRRPDRSPGLRDDDGA